MAELSQEYMEKSVPFGDIDEISSLLGEQMAEILTIAKAEPHGVEELGEIVEEEIDIPDVAQGEVRPEESPGRFKLKTLSWKLQDLQQLLKPWQYLVKKYCRMRSLSMKVLSS